MDARSLVAQAEKNRAFVQKMRIAKKKERDNNLANAKIPPIYPGFYVVYPIGIRALVPEIAHVHWYTPMCSGKPEKLHYRIVRGFREADEHGHVTEFEGLWGQRVPNDPY